MIQRGGDVVMRMLANVQQVTIKPLIEATIAPGSRIYTDEYDIYSRLSHGVTSMSTSVTGRVNTPGMMMVTAFMKCTSIPWKAFGLC